MNNLLGYLGDNCCGGRPELCAPARRKAERRSSKTRKEDCAMKRLHVHVAVEDLTQQCNKFPLTSSAE